MQQSTFDLRPEDLSTKRTGKVLWQIMQRKSSYRLTPWFIECKHLLFDAAWIILTRFHTFVEIDHEIISTVIFIPSAESFKKGCCQLQAKVCARSTG